MSRGLRPDGPRELPERRRQTMSADILDAIDGTLADWEGGPDSARWQPQVFPPLDSRHADMARRLCAATGMDGYAAWLVMADVAAFGPDSPHGSLFEVLAAAPFRPLRTVTVEITVDVAPFVEAMRKFGAAIAEIAASAGIAAGHMGKLTCGLAHLADPRSVIRCPVCRPGANPHKLPIDGHEYHRRQQNRKGRRR